MSGPGASLQKLRCDLDALVAAVLVGAPPRETVALVESIAAAVEHPEGIPLGTIRGLCLAIGLLRQEGKVCATLDALLFARSELLRHRI